mgnify:CR=1 FL=1
MKRERQVYLLDPQVLPPETIAVTFAKTSRSPGSFREIAAELTESSSAEFNEKWVVGYGHSSVAEHAVLHVAVENISRLAVETLESNRLASYTEKSTRYQTWDNDAFYIPEEFQETKIQKLYADTCADLFAVYKTCLDEVTRYLLAGETLPGETQGQKERRARLSAIDTCRFLLTASSLANVGMTINARALEHAIGKMLSSPLHEVREAGEEIKAAATESTPTLLKYANEIPYLDSVCREFSTLNLPVEEHGDGWCQLVRRDADALYRMVAAAAYREQIIDYAQAFGWAKSLDSDELSRQLKCLLSTPDSHTIPSRELENAIFTFDLLIDQGAYFEIKRHRMMTQTPQRLTALQGYAIPKLIADAGLLDRFKTAMESARDAYTALEKVNPSPASYIVPNGFNRRVLLTVNLRSLVHFIRLRSAPNAHFSVRRAAQRMAELVTEQFPPLFGLLGKNENETSGSVEAACFYTTCER